MIKFTFHLIVFLTIYSSGVVAQSTPDLLLPETIKDGIRLNISSMPIENKSLIEEIALTVFVKNDLDNYDLFPIQGQYSRENEYLVFTPYFPFENEMTYIIRTQNTDSNSNYSYKSFQVGKHKTIEIAKVLSIYPSASQLPENLLRFYIYFNTPMKKGQALKHIQLIDESGNIDSHAFMEFKQELWSADGKRLTILFDPGRIKRGVSTNLLRGPALSEGNRYKLHISSGWQDAYGQQLLAMTKELEIVNAYRNHLSINDWAIDKPQRNSYDPLTIHFDRILDHAIFQSMIELVDAEEKPIAGHWEISEKERLIQFMPKIKWIKGIYQIIIDSRLEDVTGNNLQNLLDYSKSDNENINQPYRSIEVKI